MDIDEFDKIAIGESSSEILGAVLGLQKCFLETTTQDNAAQMVLVIAVVAGLPIKGVGQLLDEVGVGHLLNKNNVGAPRCDSGNERLVMAGPIAGDDAQGAAIEVRLGRAVFDLALTEPNQSRGFVGKNQNTYEPSGRGKKCERRSKEKISSQGKKQSNATPNPDGHDREGGKGIRLAHEDNHGNEVEGQRDQNESQAKGVPRFRHCVNFLRPIVEDFGKRLLPRCGSESEVI